MDESSPAPAAPGRPEGSRLPHEPESRRRVRSDRTRRLGAFLFLAQGPIVTFTPVWTLGVFFMGLTGGGWFTVFYIIYALPVVVIGQALMWAFSALEARRTHVRRLNAVGTWAYLVHVVCVLVFPLILVDVDDSHDIGSLLTWIGLPHFFAFTVDGAVLVVGALAGVVALAVGWMPLEE
ncbi:hypothetical protein [Actinomyces gerencseriae]|uniref:hypothetical protein n=1 Tax=Actinomyces gerencseriae TaxID=52769 RepID=UPI0028E27745|nr:hypothetical protein [Actinomyces gerencseriae]